MSAFLHTIRILLADDHPLIREGIRNRLNRESDLEVVGEAKTGPDAVRLAQTLKPDVMVLDMELPGLNGLEVLQQVQEAELPVRVLGLSAYDNPEYVTKLLELGAAGYLTKEEPVERVVEAIRGIAAGEDGWLSRRAASALMQRTSSTPASDPAALLSRREREVLMLLTEGLKNTEIADRLFISSSTVKKHLNNIYEKIEVSSRAEAVSWAWKQGLR